MLEKNRGIRDIHLLQVIGIIEAAFNMALKMLLSKKLTQCTKAMAACMMNRGDS